MHCDFIPNRNNPIDAIVANPIIPRVLSPTEKKKVVTLTKEKLLKAAYKLCIFIYKAKLSLLTPNGLLHQ